MITLFTVLFVFVLWYYDAGFRILFHMADDTLQATKSYEKIIRQNGHLLNSRRGARTTRKTNGATHKVGLWVSQSQQTFPDIGLMDYGKELLGVIERPIKQPADPSVGTRWDIDDVLDDNSDLKLLRKDKLQGVVIAAWCETMVGAPAFEEDVPVVTARSGDLRVAENRRSGRREVITYFQDGNISTGTGLAKWVADQKGAIVDVRITSATDGDDGSILVDVNINGTTVFTTQTNRPEITSSDGNNFVDATSYPSIEVPNFVRGDRITLDVDDDGGTTAGTDLQVQVTIDYGELVGYLDEEFTANASDRKLMNVRCA